MAKMRGIKPETFTDDKFLQLSPLARLLFIGMWTEACDNGHVEDNAVQLKVRLLPMDSCNVSDLLAEIINTGQVARHDGYLKVVKLTEHQRIDRRYLLFCEWCEHDEHTTFTHESRKPRTADTASAQSAHDGHPSGARGVHVDEGEGERKVKVRGDEAPKRQRRPLPPDWKPTTKHQEYADEHWIDVPTQSMKFRNHALAKDLRYVDWDAAFRNWLVKALEYGQTSKPKANDRSHLPEAWR